MTRNELKNIIKECLVEVEEQNKNIESISKSELKDIIKECISESKNEKYTFDNKTNKKFKGVNVTINGYESEIEDIKKTLDDDLKKLDKVYNQIIDIIADKLEDCSSKNIIKTDIKLRSVQYDGRNKKYIWFRLTFSHPDADKNMHSIICDDTYIELSTGKLNTGRFTVSLEG